jgi:exopolysaccharide biosynthesis operon protein EpsL
MHAGRSALTATCVALACTTAPAIAQQAPTGDALGAMTQPGPTTDTVGALVNVLPEDWFRVTLGASASHDSNLFRDSGLVRPVESETITTGAVGLRVDKTYSRQRFFLDASAIAYRYSKFSDLDFNALNYFGAWYWSLTPHLSGTLSAGRDQTPTQFSYTASRQSNVVTNENFVFNLDGWLTGGWHVLLGASQYDRTSEQSSLQSQPDYSESRSEAGIRYLFQTTTSVDGLWRRIRGEQTGQMVGGVVFSSNTDYEEDQAEIAVNWAATAQSTLAGRVTRIDRHYEQTPQFDFSGTAGALRYAWLPSAKIGLALSATRNIVPFQGGFQSNYRVSNSYAVAPTWRATSKISVYFTLQRTYDNYPSTTSATERDDTLTQAALGLNWLAARNLAFTASVWRDQRSSNVPIVEYATTVSRLSASLIF